MAEYIDREKLLAFPLHRNGAHCDKEHADPHFLNGIETVIEYAETLPAENVARVVYAHWVEGKTGFYCSNCRKQPGQHPTKRGAYLSNCCPACGAIMEQKKG